MCCECSECGARVDSESPPEICPCCGTAGTLFRTATDGAELDAGDPSFRIGWFEAGFQASEPPLADLAHG